MVGFSKSISRNPSVQVITMNVSIPRNLIYDFLTFTNPTLWWLSQLDKNISRYKIEIEIKRRQWTDWISHEWMIQMT